MKEVLINVNHIRKIEVSYTVNGFRTSLEMGIPDPNAERWYTVFVGNEEYHFQRDEDGGSDPVLETIEKIYKDAIKGPTEADQPPDEAPES